MDILILGGTGAMGVPLVETLKKEGNNLYVTSRRKLSSAGNLHYIQGNAKDPYFFESLLSRKYDVIIDFMVYTTNELQERLPQLLSHTGQYCFFSSSRVYAEAKQPITEDSPRLLDVSTDQEYLLTDEYALAKAREEDLLRKSKKNWTIIRPYITYNDYRLQLGVYEKENWLYRALQGRTIVLPKDIAYRKTCLTYGPDVAAAIVNLIGNEKAYGQAFHVVNTESITWEEILEIYLDVIEEKTAKRPKVKLIDNSLELQNVWNPWQIKYDRMYDRIFDSSKIQKVCGTYHYKEIKFGLKECLGNFLECPKWLGFNWHYEAWADKIAGEHAAISEIKGWKKKAGYIKRRYLE